MTETFDHRGVYLAMALARSQLSGEIGVAACDPRIPRGRLWPGERSAVAKATDARKLEFIAGRSAARAAMEDAGIPPATVPSGANRAPVWPPELAGSITHCDTVCIAAVARKQVAFAIGIDVEPATPLDDDLLDIVCTPAERKQLAEWHATQALVLAKLIFSAKESVYKAQFTLSGKIFDFQALSVDIDLGRDSFQTEFQTDAPPFHRGYIWRGRFGILENLIVTTAVLKPGKFATMS